MTAILHLENFVGEDFSTASVREFLAAHPDEEVTIEINSPGGLASEGLAIYNALKAHNAGVIVRVTAIAASAASLIAMAGDKIVMLAGSLMMIHDPAAVAIGPASTLRGTANVLDKMGDAFAKVYAARTGKTAKAIREMMVSETWFDGDEAVASGFATSVEDHPADVFAIFDYSKFCRAPAQLLAKGIQMSSIQTSKIDASTDIFSRCEAAKLSMAETSVVMTAAAGDLEKGKDAIIAALAARDPDKTIRPTATYDGFDLELARSKPIEDALYARMSGKRATGAAQAWEGRSILDMGAALLQQDGQRITSRNKDRLASQVLGARMQHSISDFPTIAAAAGNRVMLDAYLAAQSPLKQIARQRNASDFRAITTARLSEAPSLEKVPEGAEITHGSRSESKEAFKVETFARIFAISRQALVNDDLGAFSDTLMAFGRAAAQLEAKLLADLLLENGGAGPTMEDGLAMFHSDRSNIIEPGTDISTATMSSARKLFREQKGLDGKTPLGIGPKYLLVGTGLETKAEQISVVAGSGDWDKANPFAGQLVTLCDPRLEPYAWRLFAKPEEAETLSFAYLDGNSQPTLSIRDGWEVLGQEYRAVLDFGCGVTGWRGAVLNLGDTPTA